MNGFGLFEYLLITAVAAGSWKLFHSLHPPERLEGSGNLQPLPPQPAGDGGRRQTAAEEAAASPLQNVLRRICIASRYASIEDFLGGARQAYEAITESFAKGDLEPVRFLLSGDVHDSFAEAIAQRKQRGENVEMTFVGISVADVVDAGLGDGVAWIRMRFVSQIVSVTRDRDGRNVAGHPALVVDVPELWTFERELRGSWPHWVLVGTEPDEPSN